MAYMYVNECSINIILSNSYGPVSPEKTLLKCSCFDKKPAEITNSQLGFLTKLCLFISLFVYIGPEKPQWGVDNYVYIYIYIQVPGYPAVKLSSTNFRQICPAVLLGKGHSRSMTCLVLCQENDPFSQHHDWIEVSSGILETTVKNVSSKPCKPCLPLSAILWTHMAFQSRAMSHWNVM